MSWRFPRVRIPRRGRVFGLLSYWLSYAIAAGLILAFCGTDQAHALELGNTNTTNSRLLAGGFRGIAIAMPEDGELVAIKAWAHDTGLGQVNAAIYTTAGALLSSCVPQFLTATSTQHTFTGCDALVLVNGTTYYVGLMTAGASSTKTMRHGGASMTFDGVQAPLQVLSISPPPATLTFSADSTRDYAVLLEYELPPPPDPPDVANGIEGWFLLGALVLAGVVLFGIDA